MEFLLPPSVFTQSSIVFCPLPTMFGVTCIWSGEMDDVVDHIKSHLTASTWPYLTFHTDCDTKIFHMDFSDPFGTWVSMVAAFGGKHFLIYVVYDNEIEHSYFCVVRMIGEQEDATHLGYRIGAYGLNGLVRTWPMVPMQTIGDGLIRFDEITCATLSDATIFDLCAGNGLLQPFRIIIQISRISTEEYLEIDFRAKMLGYNNWRTYRTR